MNYYINYISPIGKIIIISDGENIIGLFFENQKYFMNGINNDLLHSEIPILHKTREWLDRYFKGKRPNPLNLPLKPNGSFFRRLVWQHLLEIPYGSVVTYKDITKFKTSIKTGRTMKQIKEGVNKKQKSQKIKTLMLIHQQGPWSEFALTMACPY